jgi:ubiquinone biosynthesis monooxygenase Coq7
MRTFSFIDELIGHTDHAFKTVTMPANAERASPTLHLPASELTEVESRHSAGLMRVNHVGEVCAQALYQGQAWVSRNPINKTMLLQSAVEETDHLAWTEQRLSELGSHTSYLNPLWYAGAFILGAVAGKVSEAVSLGFVIETEMQVGAHLDRHLQSDTPLPATDARSRAIVKQMKDEELEHAAHARAAGGVELPNLVRLAMAGMAKVMTTTAYRI